jgi:hypothetical protein
MMWFLYRQRHLFSQTKLLTGKTIMSEQIRRFEVDAKDLAVNERGEVMINNPQLASEIQASIQDLGGLAASDTNYVGCGGNAYQCGGSVAGGMDELINVARRAQQSTQNQ